MANTFRCSIVTPAESVFNDEVNYATFPAWDGQQGVLQGQSPLLTRLGIGSMRIDLPAGGGGGGGSRWYFIDGGFAQIRDDVLTILTERAILPEDLSVEDAEKALAEANARATAPGENRKRAEADQQRARARKAIAQSGKKALGTGH